MQLVTRAGATRSEAYNAITSLETRLNTRKLQIGQRIKVTFQEDPNDKKAPLESLAIKTDFDKYVVATLSGTNQFTTEIVTTPTLGLKMFAEGTIDDSLFLSAKRMAVPTEIITELIRIFSFDVDFQREIRKGDHFKVYYNRRISEETGEVSNGAIVYASLTLRGKEKAFYSFTPLEKSQSGRLDFFDKDGQSARRTLMKTPVDGARISSSFGRRKHPVLGYTRMHKGADFAVYTGTPIMAAGDGIIERSSRYGSYGNYIRIQHNDTYKTAYAHLSRYGKDIKKGVRVKQGQIIGYSGATGRVTGAHLHYEVLMNSSQVNPMTLKMPTGKKLGRENLITFTEKISRLNEEMVLLKLQKDLESDPQKETKAP
jgi:murein DD-endopeptidase MepM/ murein hydrolase activator NlpD